MSLAQDIRRGDFVVAAGLLALALLFGGGSPYAPVQQMVVELGGVVALGWFFSRGWRAPRGRSITGALVLIAALFLLIILQTIPLPPSVWHALPGRGIVVGVLGAVGAPRSWQPLSLDPAATRTAGYFLIPPVAMFVGTLHLDRDAQLKLLVLIVAAALVSAILAMIQAQDAMWLTLYDTPNPTKGKGIFANKNHNAVMLVLAIPLAALVGRTTTMLRQRKTQIVATGIVIAVLAVSVAGCLSRAGLTLLPLALASCVPLLGGWGLVRQHPRITIALAVVLLVGLVVIAQSSIAQETLDRFGASREGRYVFWPDVLTAIRQFLPWGSGFGTFVPVFRMTESLNAVHQTYTNHAHSDFMEIVLEAGVAGLVLLLGFIMWLAATAWRRLHGRMGTSDFAPMLTAFVGIGLLLAASIVDYPLRTLLLACVFAVLAAMLASPVPFRASRA
ncbi:O-antigen ligase family protein [Sphingomonas sp. R86521]|uniref:O-antigen ligase family protein n=1 Tax=Sphingomonas sp. R86521 TaxID=3093860 RepID=UPI0036D363B1